jgi:hypothetical protein
MIELKEFEFCVAFTKVDLEHYSEKEMQKDLFACFKDEFSGMSWRLRFQALRSMKNPRIAKQSAIAEKMSTGLLEYVIVPGKHPSANLEFWTLDWSKR